MKNKNTKERIISVFIHIGFVIGIAVFLTTYAQDKENEKNALTSCVDWVKEFEQEAIFDDVKTADPARRAIHFTELLNEPIGESDAEGSKFYPNAAIRKKDFAVMLNYVGSLVNGTSTTFKTKKPNGKISQKEAAQSIASVFRMAPRQILKEFRRYHSRGKWVLRREAALLLFNTASKTLPHVPEEALCRKWQKEDPEIFEARYGGELPETVETPAAQATATTTPVAEPTPAPSPTPTFAPLPQPIQPSPQPSSTETTTSGTTTATGSTTAPGTSTTAGTSTPPPPANISHTCGTPINVPTETPSVQTALNSACTGDTVYVGAGTYRENINLTKNGVMLKGAAGTAPETVILDGGNSGNVLTMNTGGVYKFWIEGLTIQNASTSGNLPGSAGLYINIIPGNNFTADVMIKNLIVKNNGYGIVIENMQYGRVDIKNMLIIDNIFNGINSNNIGSSYVHITNNTIARNGRHGVRDWAGGGHRVYRNNIIVDNGWYGISTHKDSPRTILYNDVWNNTKGSYAEGFYISDENVFTPAPGTGELSVDPLLNNNFRLQNASPVINQGDPDSSYGDPDGTRNDMGAYPIS